MFHQDWIGWLIGKTMGQHIKHELQIQCWNVQGAFFNVDGDRYSKMHNDSDFEGHIKKYLIFGLIETHHTAQDIHLMQISGYRCFQVCRKKLKKGPKRSQEGLKKTFSGSGQLLTNL